VNVAVALTAFALVFPAELPDKTALASLVLGTRYPPLQVFAGVAAAFAVHVALAVTAGGLLSLLPHRVLEAIVAALFLLGAVLMLRGREETEQELKPVGDKPPVTFTRVAATSFAVIMVAEFGDLTQILTASLAARYHDPIVVALGSVLALWAVGALAITGGRGLLRIVPMTAVIRIAAAAMAVLAVISVISAVRG
jgi:putative Ca2+/H+ antiporter (TMEM165/GDT1 family)